MNRRQFNQSLMALAAVTGLPAHARTTNTWADPQPEESLPRIGLVSVGGADGHNACAIAQGLPYATRTIAIDTDAFALMSSEADKKVLIGNGAHKPQHPRQAYEMARRRSEKIEAAIDGFDFLIVLAGMRGAAGKGIAPVLAETAQRRDIGLCCIAIIPAPWQGVNANPRVRQPISQIRRTGATVFPVHGYGLARTNNEDAFSAIQTVKHLYQFVSEAITTPRAIGMDIDDLRICLDTGGVGAMGFGSANGAGYVEIAFNEAIAHPHLGMDRLLGASSVLINVRGPTDLSWNELFAASRRLRDRLPHDSYIYYTVSVDKLIGDKVIVSILASVP